MTEQLAELHASVLSFQPMTTLLLLGFLLAAQANGASAPIKAPQPALPRIDLHACPFEGCQFGDWTAQAATPFYSTWKPGPTRKQVGEVQNGEHVTAITGVHITLKPARVRITRAIPEYHLKPGDIVFLYMYQGEGISTAWSNGYWFEYFDATGMARPDNSGCLQGCNATLLEEGQMEWWVKIKTKTGQLGWVKDPNFEGMDAFAEASPHGQVPSMKQPADSTIAWAASIAGMVIPGEWTPGFPESGI